MSLVGRKSPFSLLYLNLREKTGGITFGDFMQFLSLINKGTTHEKLSWAFNFYDVNNDGIISKDELLKVI